MGQLQQGGGGSSIFETPPAAATNNTNSPLSEVQGTADGIAEVRRAIVASSRETRDGVSIEAPIRVAIDRGDVQRGKDFIDRVVDGKGISRIRDLERYLSLSDFAERRELARYALAKLNALDPDAPDRVVGKLVLVRIIQHLDPDLVVNIRELAGGLREAIESRYGVTRSSRLGDVARALRVGQLVGALGGEENRALGRRMFDSALQRLSSAPPQEIARFTEESLVPLREPDTRDVERKRAELASLLGYRAEVVDGVPMVVRGAAKPGFADLAELVQRVRGEFYYTSEDGDRWRLRIITSSPDNPRYALERPGTGATIGIGHSRLMELVQQGRFDSYLEQLSAAHAAEHNPEARRGLREHDLTRNGTAFITVTPERYDIVTAGNAAHAALLENVLIRRYGRVVEPSLIVSDTPMDQLRASIRRSIRESPRVKDVFIQLHEHGSETGIGFAEPITAKDLANLSREFPGVDLHVMSIACFGGGLRPGLQREMERAPELKKRLHFYAHTQPQVEAIAVGSQHPDAVLLMDIETTPYMLTLINKLAEGRVATFGEAVDEADRESQQGVFVNPETLINGELFGQRDRASTRQQVPG